MPCHASAAVAAHSLLGHLKQLPLYCHIGPDAFCSLHIAHRPSPIAQQQEALLRNRNHGMVQYRGRQTTPTQPQTRTSIAQSTTSSPLPSKLLTSFWESGLEADPRAH